MSSLSLAAYPNPHASPLAQRARKAETGSDPRLTQRTRRTVATRTAAGLPSPNGRPGFRRQRQRRHRLEGSRAPPAAQRALGAGGRSPLAPPELRKVQTEGPSRSPTSLGGASVIPHDAITASLVRARGRPSLAAASVGRVSGSEPQPPAPTEGNGSKPRPKVRASPGAEAGDLRRRSDRDTRPRPPPGGLGGPRRPETRRRIPEQAAAGRARSPDAETDRAGTVASGRRRRAPNTERQRGADSRAPRRGRQWPSHT